MTISFPRLIPFLFLSSLSTNFVAQLIGEWWKSDVEAVVDEATQSGLPPNISDAHTINGLPGPVSTCSSQGKIHIYFFPSMQRQIQNFNFYEFKIGILPHEI